MVFKANFAPIDLLYLVSIYTALNLAQKGKRTHPESLKFKETGAFTDPGNFVERHFISAGFHLSGTFDLFDQKQPLLRSARQSYWIILKLIFVISSSAEAPP